MSEWFGNENINLGQCFDEFATSSINIIKTIASNLMDRKKDVFNTDSNVG